ncbi:MAG: alanine--tRNA ligase [Christensenellales bacterium]|jgi:alanyl-tRNA synthetase
MRADELRDMYLTFFRERGHAIIPSASLIPENDPTVLFTTAGMHPLVPYLMGQSHPEGKRLADVQKCVRTGDIDSVGDASHCTFFEMLGNWSLGDYFKKEAIAWSYEFLTSPKWLGLDSEKLFFTVFEGDADAPRDEESAGHWKAMGVRDDHIFYLPKKYNWWGPAGRTGPCGPDTEMFIDTGKPPCSPRCNPACGCGKYLEIWNDVFMEYNKTADGKYEMLRQKNVDTGMGLDRTACILQGKASVYETDVFTGIMRVIGELCAKRYGQDEGTTRAMRIVADHIRCATFILGDQRGVTPSNVDQGYVLRRLIRRSVRFGMQLGIKKGGLIHVAAAVVDQYGGVYPELNENREAVMRELTLEEDRFANTITHGLREFDKLVSRLRGSVIEGPDAFRLYDTYGFPIELTVELAAERNLTVDRSGFDASFEKHRQVSQAGASQRFKGGLADASEMTTRLHTATHLLLASLRRVLGDEVSQKGSNITAERLRFDFSFPRKLTKEELSKVEALVNEAIAADHEVNCEEMPVEEARASGATGVFDARYDNVVKVYSVGDLSREICGGPHVERTGELGRFRIKKEESSSAGVRRIRAVLE